METVNKVYHAASHAVWGDEQNKSGEEPVSGETGQGTATDPYDAGNKEGMGTPALSHQDVAAASLYI
jgi:hypothetical protein